jgi:hypothetical protein
MGHGDGRVAAVGEAGALAAAPDVGGGAVGSGRTVRKVDSGGGHGTAWWQGRRGSHGQARRPGRHGGHEF